MTPPVALDLEELRRRIVELETALDFRASVTFVSGFHGGDLLRGIAAWMDRVDDRDGVSPWDAHGRMVQADLRRWADTVDAALAASTPKEDGDRE